MSRITPPQRIILTPASKTRGLADLNSLLLAVHTVAADNLTQVALTCNGTGMDWHSVMVGETPCQTYQKLCQICNPECASASPPLCLPTQTDDFLFFRAVTVGMMNTVIPPDTCSDPVSGCCCNSIEWALSMLCLNCQQDIGTTNRHRRLLRLPGLVQQPPVVQPARGHPDRVGNEPIRIEDYIYVNGWPSGAWFYGYSSAMIKSNNSFMHCALLTSSASLSMTVSASSSVSKSSASCVSFPFCLTLLPLIHHPTQPLPPPLPPPLQRSAPTPSPHPCPTKKKASMGAIAGGAIGSAIILFLRAVSCSWPKRWEQRRHEWVLEELLGRDVFEGSGRGENGRETAELDERLVMHGYTYRPDALIATGTKWACLTEPHGVRGAGHRVGGDNAPGYDTQSTGLHTTWQADMSSTVSVNAHTSLPPSASTVGLSGSGRRADLAELFLEEEHEPWLKVETDWHMDAAPVSNFHLGWSASRRLPPTYGEQI
ncbi:hypothetical protein B0H10DRAFT_2230327 [Mycena sp. CBHHK59/15]|nr:hypothetical protein B0H10DRAFT_2230327 [Mycena sp. CBHHK59/15]